MAAETYQNITVDPGFVQGPPAVAPLAAEARHRQGAAFEALGGALGEIGAKIEHAQTLTRLNDATTQALTGINDLEQKYAHDADFRTAPKRFSAEADALAGKIVGESGLDPAHAAELRTRMARLSIGSGAVVQRGAWNAEQAQNISNLGQAANGFQQRYLAAGSDTGRQAVLDEHRNLVATTVAAGWIGADVGQREVQNFHANAQTAEAMRMIGDDPQRAAQALADPQRFASIDPVRRASLSDQAKAALDTNGLLHIGSLAQRAPERAAAVVGKASDPQTVAAIYDKGVIPQESRGHADAVSPAGALGVGQLMPGTARDAARRLGLADVAALPDAELRTRLLADAGLNRKLGLAEFSRLIDRYDGDIPAALAAYNAGTGGADKPRADAWRAQAIEKFGPNYTPEQFAGLIPIKETREYVGAVYARLGARGDALGLSQNARMRAQTSVGAAVAADDAQRRALLARMAADAVVNDPIADSLKGGTYVDPARITAQRQLLSQAAVAGDAKATGALRQLDYAEEAAPVMAQAYRMAPSDLSALVASERARLSNSGGTPGDERRLQTLETVLSDVAARKNADPIGLATRAGAFRAEPLPVGDPHGAGFGAALATRDAQAVAAAKLYDGALAPLRPEEASALKNHWAQGSVSDRLGLAAQFAGHLRPDVAEAAMRQVAGNDSLARVAGLVALRDPDVGRKILEGSTLLDAPAVKPRVVDVRAALADVAKGDLYPSPQMQNEAIEAGLAVYAANRAQSGTLFDPGDRTGMENALQEVTGKVAKINGARTPIPPGFSPAAVSRGMANLSADDLAPFGGLQKGLDAADVAAHGRLHALRIGGAHYAVTLGDRPVMDAAGAPLIVDLAQIAAAQRARALAPFASAEEAARAVGRHEPVHVPASAEEAAFGARLVTVDTSSGLGRPDLERPADLGRRP